MSDCQLLSELSESIEVDGGEGRKHSGNMLPFYFCLTFNPNCSMQIDWTDCLGCIHSKWREAKVGEASNQIPHDWNGFLRDDENKTELFKFLAEQAVNLGGDKQKISTFEEQGICNPPGL